MKILLYIRFLGTAYHGYQSQKNGTTVQEVLNRAAESLFGFPCDIVGCSRTDSGVHANMFCATVSAHGKADIVTRIPTEKIPIAINYYLPSDIRVYQATPVPDEFHARYDVVSKEYVYRILAAPTEDPFVSGRCMFRRMPISDEAIARMNAAAAHLVGEHDFGAFMAEGSKVTSTVRTVKYANVSRDGGMVVLRICADGFLYHMVRIVAGTLLDVADGKLSPDDIPAILQSKDRSRAGFTAPAEGLYLNSVSYK